MIKSHKRDQKKNWDDSSAERNFQLDGSDAICTGS